MLVLTRKSDETIVLDLEKDSNTKITLGELFADGPIRFHIINAVGQVRVGIDAPQCISIKREPA